MSADELVRIFGYLRETCDPRGHFVLDALEELLADFVEGAAHLKNVHDRIPLERAFNEVQHDITQRAIREIVGDTHDHSKFSDLRVVRGGRCV